MAKATHSVVAELKMVPNQPLVFNNDGKPRTEDDLIAYGWVKFMDTGDPTWSRGCRWSRVPSGRWTP